MLKELLADYAVPANRFDELLAGPGVPREHWDAFLRALAARARLIERIVARTSPRHDSALDFGGARHRRQSDNAAREP